MAELVVRVRDTAGGGRLWVLLPIPEDADIIWVYVWTHGRWSTPHRFREDRSPPTLDSEPWYRR